MGCETLRQTLGAFVDGELPGADMLRVSQHLQACAACAAEAESLTRVGDLLREAVRQDPAPHLPEGLAGGVVAQIGAESALSWRALFARAVDDWHWAAVGAGSVAATFVLAVAVGAVLWFGPAPERADSLKGLMSNLEGSAGTLWIEGRRSGIDTQNVMMQVDSGFGSSRGALRAVPAVLSMGIEADLVSLLIDRVARGDRLVALDSMSEIERRYTEDLLDAISRLRMNEPAFGSTGHLTVYRVRLLAATGVTAKALQP